MINNVSSAESTSFSWQGYFGVQFNNKLIKLKAALLNTHCAVSWPIRVMTQQKCRSHLMGSYTVLLPLKERYALTTYEGFLNCDMIFVD